MSEQEEVSTDEAKFAAFKVMWDMLPPMCRAAVGMEVIRHCTRLAVESIREAEMQKHVGLDRRAYVSLCLRDASHLACAAASILVKEADAQVLEERPDTYVPIVYEEPK